mmetsp:Transcript_12920/g.38756  ORF Transcript_12920/g.38756 Transcript_12920/m.38756 type:complete len:103 (-) Transcript_12920:3-311(-)
MVLEPKTALPRVVALDLDGTTLDARHRLRDETVAAIRDVRGAGCRVVLATGRPTHDVQPIVDRIGLQLDCVPPPSGCSQRRGVGPRANAVFVVSFSARPARP